MNIFDQSTDIIIATAWIDVCPRDANLLAAGGHDYNVKVYDRRESKIVKTFGDGLHSSIKSAKSSKLNNFIKLKRKIRFNV